MKKKRKETKQSALKRAIKTSLFAERVKPSKKQMVYNRDRKPVGVDE